MNCLDDIKINTEERKASLQIEFASLNEKSLLTFIHYG